MRKALLITTAALAAAAWGCNGGSSSSRTPSPAGTSSPAASTTAKAPATASKTPVASTPAPSVNDQVTGIVGSVNASTHTIQIDRLSGAPVTRITVDSTTVIRIAGGGTTTLSSVRVSDRIVASGHLNDRNDALVATDITVQSVVSGGEPGG